MTAININDLTIGQVKTLQAMFVASGVIAQASDAACVTDRPIGWRILVLDRGFVYVGNVRDMGDHYEVTDGRNIRCWGTTKGLGELAAGPLSGTKHDKIPTAEVPKRAVIILLHADGAKW